MIIIHLIGVNTRATYRSKAERGKEKVHVGWAIVEIEPTAIANRRREK